VREKQETAIDQRQSLNYQIGYDTGFKDGFNKGIEETHTITSLSTKPIQVSFLEGSDLSKILREGLNQQLIKDKAALTEENAKLAAQVAALSNINPERLESMRRMVCNAELPPGYVVSQVKFLLKDVSSLDLGEKHRQMEKVVAACVGAKRAMECWGEESVYGPILQALADLGRAREE